MKFEIGKIYIDEKGLNGRFELISRNKHRLTFKWLDAPKSFSKEKRLWSMSSAWINQNFVEENPKK